MITIAFRVNPSEKDQLMMEAKNNETCASWIMRRLVHLYLNDEEVRSKVKDFEPRPIMKGEF